jgi:small nuclear ribonucleoprotein D3
VKLLAIFHLSTLQVELKNGDMFRGELHQAQDNWNVQLSNVVATAKDGKVSHVEHMFIRGSRVRFIIVPDMLKNAPMFKRFDPKNKVKGPLGVGGRGRGGGSGGGPPGRS